MQFLTTFRVGHIKPKELWKYFTLKTLIAIFTFSTLSQYAMHTLHTVYIICYVMVGGVLTQKCLTFCLQSNKALQRRSSGEYLEFFCGQITKEHNGSPSQESGVKTHIPIMQCGEMKLESCTWINESMNPVMQACPTKFNTIEREDLWYLQAQSKHPKFRWNLDWMAVLRYS